MSDNTRKFLDAIIRNDSAVVISALERGQDANAREFLPYEHGEPALMLAVLFDKAGDILRALLEHGAEVDAREERYGRTALSIRVHPLLLEYGADVNAKDDEGESVLLRAVERGDVVEVEWLLERDVDVKGSEGEAARNCARCYGFVTIYERLIEAAR